MKRRVAGVRGLGASGRGRRRGCRGARGTGGRGSSLLRFIGFQGELDELADCFGAGGDAVGPSVFVDLLQEPGGYGDDDARVWLLWFAGHGGIVPWGQHAVNMTGMLAS